MEHTAKLILKTEEVDINKEYNLTEDMKVIAGKAAGICYMADDYLSEGIQNIEKAKKRAEGTAKSGHTSTYEHGHISLLIETNKMMCMILNSLNLYSTSEKSSRYTAMHPSTEYERDMYGKWQGIFTNLISAYYKDLLTEKEISKLAMENARYMISVFTPTVLEYTIPYSRGVLTVQWLNDLATTIYECKDNGVEEICNNYDNFYSIIAIDCKKLATAIKEALQMDDEYLIVNNKNMGIELFSTLETVRKLSFIGDDRFKKCDRLPFKESHHGNTYTSNYECSFAALAQEQRHRTLHYYISIPVGKKSCYVPPIIKDTIYEAQWIEDFNMLIRNKIIPQCTLVNVCEEGRFEDFVLKCKERLCARAQYEIMEITKQQVTDFYKYLPHLNPTNISMLRNMITFDNDNNVIVKSRCQFEDYTCKETCKLVNSKTNYYRNI